MKTNRPITLMKKVMLPLAGSMTLLFFTYLMFAIVAPYSSGRLDIDFLLTKQEIIHLLHYQWAFYLHIFSSLFILAAGVVQFSRWVRERFLNLHRWVGRVYILLILVISAPAALVMSFYGNGGAFAQMSFVILSLLWWWFTYKAFATVRKGDIRSHQKFMIRSYALTLSAISLRISQMLLSEHTLLEPETIYLTISWSSWVGNLLVAEWIIRIWISRNREFGSARK